MTLLQLAVIAVVQGITEFLPISSSAHLLLIPEVTGWTYQGLVIDLASHVGSLLAVVAYFHRDVWTATVGAADLVRGKRTPARRLLLLLIVATVPIVIAGAALVGFGGGGELAFLRNIQVIGWTLIGFAILLYLVDRAGMTIRRIEYMTYGQAVVIGILQILALAPGTSRSGITMTGGRLLGFERIEAARFASLMSIPAILAAATPSAIALVQSGDVAAGIDAAITVGLTFFAALVALAAMMRWLRFASFAPFVVYRLILGGIVLYWVYV
ncbi:MAG: undecaprenyl-diphosphate phosphatase [Alphaproteobacteria bacterium]|nr:undecaprenyl-diphosphate phosphatase [Alphaproteobacteria bacterium]